MYIKDAYVTHARDLYELDLFAGDPLPQAWWKKRMSSERWGEVQ